MMRRCCPRLCPTFVNNANNKGFVHDKYWDEDENSALALAVDVDDKDFCCQYGAFGG